LILAEFIKSLVDYYQIDLTKHKEKIDITKGYLNKKAIPDYSNLFEFICTDFTPTGINPFPAIYHIDKIIKEHRNDIIKHEVPEKNEAIKWYDDIFLNDEQTDYDYKASYNALNRCFNEIYKIDPKAKEYSFSMLLFTAWTNNIIENNFDNFYNDEMKKIEAFKKTDTYINMRNHLKDAYINSKKFKIVKEIY